MKSINIFIISRFITTISTLTLSFALDLLIWRYTESYELFIISAALSVFPGAISINYIAKYFYKLNFEKSIKIVEYINILIIMVFLFTLSLTDEFVTLSLITVICLSIIDSCRRVLTNLIIGSCCNDDEELTLANGKVQSLSSSTFILSPILGVFFTEVLDIHLGLKIIILLLIISILFLHLAKIKSIKFDYKKNENGFVFSLRWINENKTLRKALIVISLSNLIFSSFIILHGPILLPLYGSYYYSMSMVSNGIGIIFGGIAFTKFIKKSSINRIEFLIALQLFTILIWSLLESIYSKILLDFIFGMMGVIVASMSQQLWFKYTPINIQPAVFSARVSIATILSPIALIATIPLIKFFFEDLKIQGLNYSSHEYFLIFISTLSMMIFIKKDKLKIKE